MWKKSFVLAELSDPRSRGVIEQSVTNDRAEVTSEGRNYPGPQPGYDHAQESLSISKQMCEAGVDSYHVHVLPHNGRYQSSDEWLTISSAVDDNHRVLSWLCMESNQRWQQISHQLWHKWTHDSSHPHPPPPTLKHRCSNFISMWLLHRDPI